MDEKDVVKEDVKKKESTKPDNRMHIFTVMHSAGEFIAGVRIGAHEQFNSIMTPELKVKVDKGFLVLDK